MAMQFTIFQRTHTVIKRNMFRTMVNRSDPATNIGNKIETGVQIIGAFNSIYDIGKTIAPYAVRVGASLL